MQNFYLTITRRKRFYYLILFEVKFQLLWKQKVSDTKGFRGNKSEFIHLNLFWRWNKKLAITLKQNQEIIR